MRNNLVWAIASTLAIVVVAIRFAFDAGYDSGAFANRTVACWPNRAEPTTPRAK